MVEQQMTQSKKDKAVRFIKISQASFTRAAVTQNAAEMAYFILLSLFPILLVVANIIPFFPIDPGEVLPYLQAALPGDIYNVLEPILLNYLESGSGGAISIGLVTSFWSASKIISITKRVLNQVYGAKETNNFLLARAMSFLIMGLIFLAVAIVIGVFIFGEAILGFVENLIGINFPLIEQILSLKWFVLLVILIVLFTLVYNFVPSHHLKIKYALPGAVFATVGWILLSELFSVYLHFVGGDAVTNATFGTFIALMLFLYLSSIIVLLGAVVNTIHFEWKTGDSTVTFNQRQQRKQEVEESGQEMYPKDQTYLLQRKLTKVNSLKEREREATNEE
ncbi:YihY/virulence factor BrkB family protein [Lacticigenium naphthae]|uniref:YihY/virulence factor BrkB family protein n=1 Tax=Lacticigenium naphthae TaxID=515351 RepID=UPI00041C7871|nr:YihY/virulence factor BrkB family protein [Lacticigenium naphthae]